MRVKVSGLSEARKLADACSHCDCEIDAITGSRSCDAKSVLGIMSLDLMSEIELKFICEETAIAHYVEIVEQYLN